MASAVAVVAFACWALRTYSRSKGLLVGFLRGLLLAFLMVVSASAAYFPDWEGVRIGMIVHPPPLSNSLSSKYCRHLHPSRAALLP